VKCTRVINLGHGPVSSRLHRLTPRLCHGGFVMVAASGDLSAGRGGRSCFKATQDLFTNIHKVLSKVDRGSLLRLTRQDSLESAPLLGKRTLQPQGLARGTAGAGGSQPDRP